MVNKNGAFDKRAPFLRADTKHYSKHHNADFFLRKELGGVLRIGSRIFRKDLTPLSSVAYGVHSEHILKEQSDAQNVVSRFPFRGHPLP